MSKIEPLGDIQWGAHAALASAMEDVAPDQPIIVIWADARGAIHHRSARLTNQEVLWLLEKKKQDVLG